MLTISMMLVFGTIGFFIGGIFDHEMMGAIIGVVTGLIFRICIAGGGQGACGLCDCIGDIGSFGD